MNTFWDAFGWLLGSVGHHLGNEEIVPEIGWPRVTRVIRELPGAPEIDPCVPLKDLQEQSQDPGMEGLYTGTLIRNTPLVPKARWQIYT